MKIKLIVTALLLGGHLYANAQTSVSDTIRSQHTFRLHNNTEVTESKTVVVTEEPAQKKKKNKVKVRKPKNMEYRLIGRKSNPPERKPKNYCCRN